MNALTSTTANTSQGELLPSVWTGMVFKLRGTTFRVTQVIESSNAVYLETKHPNGRWAGFDRGGDLRALQLALASASH